MYIYIYSQKHFYAFIWKNMHIYTHSLTYLSIYIYIYIYACTHTHTSLHRYAYMHIYMRLDEYVGKFGDLSWGWSKGSLFNSLWGVGVVSTPFLLLCWMLRRYHFLSVWCDLTWNWTSVSWAIGKHSTNKTNGLILYIYIYIIMHTWSYKLWCAEKFLAWPKSKLCLESFNEELKKLQ